MNTPSMIDRIRTSFDKLADANTNEEIDAAAFDLFAVLTTARKHDMPVSLYTRQALGGPV